jgi:hypothetical protein
VQNPLAVELPPQMPLPDEALAFQNVFRPVVIVENVDAELLQVHLLEGETDQRPDRIAAETAVPRSRLADEKAEPGGSRDPVDLMNRGVADVRAVVFALDGEMALVRVRSHRAVEPLDLGLERNRIPRLERPDDARIVHPAVGALRVLSLECPQDHMLARDHESASRRLSLGRKCAFSVVSHWR